ncbi:MULTISPECIES: TIGR02594 family protein [unclassified Paraburkholderia]|uniref:TIGR02594 family protein n=1 Tax=unclassified Paraburkholderia TaxID=2615204 RepID=UPI00160AD20A|nr:MULTISPECIES: TIGR02594 family protein [unclassified Paraburkholderia]MBB5447157.1 flagellar protein FlgJ [Paraburkholderia sp. WSM4177]MBB5487738.1 flagellar protein FlgJ [Paraburkholderia sp. WSM4180]
MTEYTYEDKLLFVKNLYCPARQVAAETGCSWELILAQAVQETGWGKKVLPGTNNIFNIKANAGWSGESKMFHVSEINANGEKIWVDDLFRVYLSVLDSLRDRQIFLAANPRFARAGLFDADVKGDLVSEARALQQAGYATDPKYASELEDVYKGKTMQRAIAAAKQEGCAGCLPVINVRVLDAARQPIVNAKLKATQGAKTAEFVTDEVGYAQIKAAQAGGPVSVRVWSERDRQWVTADGTLTPSSTSIAVTLMAPTITVTMSTELHKQSGALPVPNKDATTGKPEVHPRNAQYDTYTIKKGDSLSGIAKAHSTSYVNLARLNGIVSPYCIYPGQIIQVPPRNAGSSLANVVSQSMQTKEKSTIGGVSSVSSIARTKEQPDSVAAVQLRDGEKPENVLHVIQYRSETDHPQTDLMAGRHAPWMQIAEREFKAGVRRRGTKHPDQHIIEYFTATSVGRQKTDMIAYCAAFINWCMTQCGYDGSHSAMANSFAKWGRPTRENMPAYGAVALVHFPEGGYHVTFVNGRPSNMAHGPLIATLGGNQGRDHEVSHSKLPASWVTHYRFPYGYEEIDEDYELNAVQVDSARMSAASTR